MLRGSGIRAPLAYLSGSNFNTLLITRSGVRIASILTLAETGTLLSGSSTDNVSDRPSLFAFER